MSILGEASGISAVEALLLKYTLASLIVVLVTSCPLPYDFNGVGSGKISTDP